MDIFVKFLGNLPITKKGRSVFMQQYYKFDNEGHYIEPVIAEYGDDNHMPDNVTDVPPPQPMYLARFDGEAWVETKPKPEPPDGKVSRWDGDAKDWIIEDEPGPQTPPGTIELPEYMLNEPESDFVRGMIASQGGLEYE